MWLRCPWTSSSLRTPAVTTVPTTAGAIPMSRQARACTAPAWTPPPTATSRCSPATSTASPTSKVQPFAVAFTNQGENDEFDVKVTLRISARETATRSHSPRRSRGRARVRRGHGRAPARPPAAARRRGDDPRTVAQGSRASRPPTTTGRATRRCSRGAEPPLRRLSGVVNDLTDPAVSPQLAAGAAALIAVIWLLAARGQASGGSAARSRSCSARHGHPPIWSRTRAGPPARRSKSCTAASRRSPNGSTSAWPEAERRIDGSIANRSRVRYDAYGEMSGHQSTSLALLDADHNGVVLSSIAHRDTARLYCKQVHGRARRARALARGGRGDPPGAGRRRRRVAHRDARSVMRVAYLGSGGTVSHEALRSVPRPGRSTKVPQPTLGGGRPRGARRRSRPRARPDRERARGLEWTRCSTRWCSTRRGGW